MKMTVLHGHPGQNGVNVHILVAEEPVLEKENVDYQMALKYLMSNVQMVSTKYYCKIASSNTSHLEAHVGFFKWLMKGIFDLYVL